MTECLSKNDITVNFTKFRIMLKCTFEFDNHDHSHDTNMIKYVAHDVIIILFDSCCHIFGPSYEICVYSFKKLAIKLEIKLDSCAYEYLLINATQKLTKKISINELYNILITNDIYCNMKYNYISIKNGNDKITICDKYIYYKVKTYDDLMSYVKLLNRLIN